MTFDRDRFRGCLIGLAAGDALGTTLEFKRPGTFEPITDMIGGGPFGLQPGQWTDDTSMALCLAESLLECGGSDPADQMRRYVRWWRDGYWSSTGRCFDIGNTVGTALSRFERTGEPLSGSTDPRSAGNGSIMRLAPVPMFHAADPALAVQAAADSSRTTHGAAEAVDACRYLSAMIVAALAGASKSELLGSDPHVLPGLGPEPLSSAIDAIAGGSFREREPPRVRGTGYVVASLEAALWAIDRSEDFRSGALMAVNLGDDADTTGAVYGQLAGAFYGEAGIPVAWRRRLARVDEIERLADRLYDAATGPTGHA
jgi:ADP-ribosylglycohydrolase